MSFKALLDEIRESINRAVAELHIECPPFLVEPSKPGFGDAMSNLPFLLASNMRQSPKNIADKIADTISGQKSGKIIGRIEAHPSGYLNFFADKSKLHKMILQQSSKSRYGRIDAGRHSQIIIEHTSVNPNKALHIGHIRNISVGDSLARILKFADYDVLVLNYVDDSGLQVADIILGFTVLGFNDEPPPNEKFDQYCGSTVYVETTKQYDSKPELNEERSKILQAIEDENSSTAKLAMRVTRRVLQCQMETCWRMNVRYDCLNFESQIIHSGLWEKTLARLKEDGIVRFEEEGKNAGCWIIPDDADGKVLVRSNGTATYLAKDIPYAAWKLGIVMDPFSYVQYSPSQPDAPLLQTTLQKSDISGPNLHPRQVITVIDSRQSRLQKMVTEIMSKFTLESRYKHLAYESVTLSSDTARRMGVDMKGRQVQMSGRKGLFINADKVLDTLEEKITVEMLKRNPDWSKDAASKTACDIAVGVLRYEMIRQDLDKIITFDLAKSTSMDGDTAVYVQYAHARSSRILEKAPVEPSFDSEFDLLDGGYESALIQLIGLFSLRVEDAAKNFAPKIIARYCHDLAVSFNSFYEHVRVIDTENKDATNQRLCLVLAFKRTLKTGLHLIGVPSPDRM